MLKCHLVKKLNVDYLTTVLSFRQHIMLILSSVSRMSLTWSWQKSRLNRRIRYSSRLHAKLSFRFGHCSGIRSVKAAHGCMCEQLCVLCGCRQQELSNLLHEKKYLKALGLAISLDQPHTVLTVIKGNFNELLFTL